MQGGPIRRVSSSPLGLTAGITTAGFKGHLRSLAMRVCRLTRASRLGIEARRARDLRAAAGFSSVRLREALAGTTEEAAARLSAVVNGGVTEVRSR